MGRQTVPEKRDTNKQMEEAPPRQERSFTWHPRRSEWKPRRPRAPAGCRDYPQRPGLCWKAQSPSLLPSSCPKTQRLEATLSISVPRLPQWVRHSIFILTLSKPSFLHSTCGSPSQVWHRIWILSLGRFQSSHCLWLALHPSQLPGTQRGNCASVLVSQRQERQCTARNTSSRFTLREKRFKYVYFSCVGQLRVGRIRGEHTWENTTEERRGEVQWQEDVEAFLEKYLRLQCCSKEKASSFCSKGLRRREVQEILKTKTNHQGENMEITSW